MKLLYKKLSKKILEIIDNKKSQIEDLKKYLSSKFDEIFIQNKSEAQFKELSEICEFSNGKAHEKFVVEDQKGKYILVNSKFISTDGKVYKTLSPSFSSENFSNHPLGEALFATPYEQSLLWQLFTDTIQAAKILGKDQDKIEVWQNIRDTLYGPIQIGADGQVKEWYID